MDTVLPPGEMWTCSCGTRMSCGLVTTDNPLVACVIAVVSSCSECGDSVRWEPEDG